MDNLKQLRSAATPASSQAGEQPWSPALESTPTGKYDPEYDVATTAEWLRRHARLLFQLSEGSDGTENRTLTNLLMHANELLLFTLGWLEAQQPTQPSANRDEMILAVRDVYARVRSYITQGSGKLVELGLCFEDLSSALGTL